MKVPISEIFGPTVQGEGILAGQRTMFIRVAGCDGVSGQRDWCKWCDSMHAVDPANKAGWRWMSTEEIFQEVHDLAPWCQEVTISGGNPALHNLDALVRMLDNWGYGVNIETQATYYQTWISNCDTVTMSPKPPSAGLNSSPDTYGNFLELLWHDVDSLGKETLFCTKVVVGDEADLRFARDIFNIGRRIIPWMPMYLSVLTDPSDTADTLLAKYRELIHEVSIDKIMPDVFILPQIHVLVWGHKLGV